MGVTPQQIARIRIATYGPALDVAGNPAPATAAEARFSLPYVVATALVHGSVRLAAFQPLRLADPVTRSLMERITLEIDPELDQRFPGQRAARVVIETRDGRREEFFQPTRKGDPEHPLSDDELGEKFMELAAPVVGSNGARSLLKRLWEIDSATSIAELVP